MFAVRGMSEEWFVRASVVVAGTKYIIMRDMSEKWFQEASVVAGTIYIVVEMSDKWFQVAAVVARTIHTTTTTVPLRNKLQRGR